jgi:ATP-dependent helicase/nuclease subunit B
VFAVKAAQHNKHTRDPKMGALMSAISGRVYTVAPGVSFLDALARAILNGAFASGELALDPMALGDTTIMLPTRRAARQLQQSFLDTSKQSALLLPTIRPIGEASEDLTLLHALMSREGALGDANVPPAAGELERRLVLATLVMRWSDALRGRDLKDSSDRTILQAAGARTPAQAMHLARELARLIDMVETENAELRDLEKLVPDVLSEHWQQTLEFLKIILEFWPAHLESAGRLSPADRRNRLILGEAERIQATKPAGPLIVAGVTGSIPATTELMRAVLRKEQGAVVLPGLDVEMDEAEWDRLAQDNPEHPQCSLAKLLRALDVKRCDVRALPSAVAGDAFAARSRLINEAMRPAATTHLWHRLGETIEPVEAEQAFEGVHRLTAPSAQDEAEAIALIMRHAAEVPGKTAALVSPDRLLARRVAIRLESWGIRVDDSAGRPFVKTVPGAFLDLAIDAFAQNFAPAATMALLKHPLTRLGWPALEIRRAARTLEVGAFRAPYIGNGIDGILASLDRQDELVDAGERRDRAGRRLRVEDWARSRELIEEIREAYAPLLALRAEGGEHALQDLAEAHLKVGEALARVPEADKEEAAAEGAVSNYVMPESTKDQPVLTQAVATEETCADEAPNELWRDEAGAAAAQLFAHLIDRALVAPELSAEAYPDFYRSLIAGEAVRSLIPVHPRLSIWGPFEARLQRPDIVILGSLNEGTWPEAADPGPWLNRPMRAELGLPQPEERIGQAAHDVTQMLGADTVYVTRALKVDGNPTVPSRWLLRLDAVLAAVGAADALSTDDLWLAWARARDGRQDGKPATQPAPRPPIEMRPRALSVSAVETWIANPYAIFAGRILKLDALPTLGAEPDASLRGSIVHAALGRFVETYPEQLPDDSGGELLRIATEIFRDYKSHPRVAAFWMQRFERFSAWFGEAEPGLRRGILKSLAEADGALVLDAPAGPFKLTARADRIDASAHSLTITDYKTGASLSTLKAQAERGEAPQLPLEAAIAGANGFAHVPELPVQRLQYISASGGEPPGAVVALKLDDIAAHAEKSKNELQRLVAQFDDVETPYRATRRARFNYDYDAYAQLARVAEWAADDGGEAAA